ncbi:DUF5017 domain-containing protein [Parapedobacter sp. SGR-10]|uniref:DUF5017 domain-containing protein n=1 Tax=Parapedobacter sp. SGR-10 TaxID=2710879 RepID=UPI0013D7AD1B|nr:DUF5017 domain-containing protein [Parapedobacter sp. SGR-10]NGF57998.1 DUF5017 domain-containing protein [Parapedobacter sp. SGR-10]
MKTLSKILIAIVSIGLVSCERDIEVSGGLEEFDVTVDKTVFQKNEEVMFHFKGNPDMISFYSGEIYNDYNFRESRVIDLQKTIVNFRNAYPTLAGSQVSDFKVLVSTDFNNSYSYDNLISATWHDITSEFTYGTSGTYVASGDYEISELYEQGKPLYFAFRYSSLPQGEHGPVRRRAIQSVQFLGESIYGTHVLADIVTSDFRIVEKSEDAKTASTISATTINLDGYARSLPTDPDPATDTWVVTKALDLDRIDSGPDRAVAIKGNKDPLLKNHIHVFTEPGEYIVTFLGINANIGGYKEVVKQIKITIEDE